MKRKLNTTLHTFLIGLFSILFIYAHNIYYLDFKQLLLPVTAIITLTLIGLYLLTKFYTSSTKAALFLSFFWLFFFSYGAIHTYALEKLSNTVFAHHSILLTLTGILLLGWGVLLYFTTVSPKAIKLANFFALVLVSVPVINIVKYTAGEATVSSPTGHVAAPLYDRSSADTTSLPDIVYIILDGYGREDQLRKKYGFDNSAFINSLEQHGFQVADESRSNYCRTAVSVASSLNFNYIHSIAGYEESQSYETLDELGEESVLVHFLKKYGYNLVSFKTGFNVAELSRHVTLLSKEKAVFGDLSTMLFEATPFIIVINNAFLFKRYSAVASFFSEKTGYKSRSEENLRYRSLYPLDSIPEYVGKPTPSFVFADIYVGHPPFIFDSTGNFMAPDGFGASGEGNTYMPKAKDRVIQYKEGLKGQTHFLNSRVLSLVGRLKKNMARPTIIILQGDHGPGIFYHQTELEATDLQDRFSILNAVYLPERYKVELPEDLTPVNTWRYLLNSIFKTDLPILPNRHFYSGMHTPSKFTEVTKQLAPTPHKKPASHAYSRSSGVRRE